MAPKPEHVPLASFGRLKPLKEIGHEKVAVGTAGPRIRCTLVWRILLPGRELACGATVGVEPGLVLENGYTNLGLTMDGPGAGPAILWSRNFSWTRDPFDRIITAQASLNEALLITKDGSIRKNYARAVWDEA